MFEKALESVIFIDTDRETVHFYTTKKNGAKNEYNYHLASYKARPYSPEFYDKIGNVLANFRENHPDAPLQRVSLILSDSTVLTDTVNIPVINKKAMDSSLAATLSNLYNSAELKFNRYMALQNRQIATYAVTAMKKEMLFNLHTTFTSHQIGIANVTFASSALTNAVLQLNAKLRNASFVLLDIEDESARIILVAKGKTLGFYSLPFGSKILYKTRVMPEDLLFDHSVGELVVLNAREKAKAKALTMAEDVITEPAEGEPAADGEQAADGEETEIAPAPKPKADEDDDFEYDETAEEENEEFSVITKGRKKKARKLPKFMLRPTPTNREGFMYENFRTFVKWTLEVIAGNSGIIALGAPEAVYVNMPEEYNFLYDMVNMKEEDHGLRFEPLNIGEVDDFVKKNLELYGGFYVNQYNGLNNFHASQLDNVKPKTNDKDGKNTDKSNSDEPSGGRKFLETLKKIATYDLTGGGN